MKYRRQQRSQQVLMKLSGLSQVKTLEDYDFNYALVAPKSQVIELFNLSFIPKAENIVFLGASGVGKHIYPWPWIIRPS